MTLLVFLYVAGAVFLLGNAVRIARIALLPRHLRWELYPMPRGAAARQRYGGSYFEDTEWWTKPPSSSRWSELGYILREVMTFATLRKRNRPLWLWSWLMHLGGYGLGVTAALLAIAALTGNSAAIRVCAIVSSCAGLAGVSGLFVRRLRNAQMRAGTSRVDLFNLLLIAAVFGSATCVHLLPGGTRELVTFTRALLRLEPVPVIGWPAAAQLFLLGVFAAYFPATHMTHAYMKFFTYHRVRWDDSAVAHHPEMNRIMRANAQRPITWAARHIAAGENSTWADVVGGRRS